MAAGDVEAAAELVIAHWNDWFNRGRPAAVTTWLDQLPSARVRTDHRLCAARAWLALDRGELDGVDPWLTAGDDAIRAAEDDGAEPRDLAALRDLAVLCSVHQLPPRQVTVTRSRS